MVFFDFLYKANYLQQIALAVGFWHIWEARNEERNARRYQTILTLSVIFLPM
jgi:hypothetical protein